MSKQTATTDNNELVLDAPIDDFTMNGFMYSAKTTCQGERHRVDFILDEQDNIMNNVIEAITDGKINFLLLGYVVIKNDIKLTDLGVFISGRDKPLYHNYFRTFYYESLITINGTNKKSVKEAFDRLERALDIISVASFGADLSYYIGIKHVNLFICKQISAKIVASNVAHLNALISNLDSKYIDKFNNMYSLIRKAQKTSSPYESFLMTWNAVDIACSLCDEIFHLKDTNSCEIDICQLFLDRKPKTIAEATGVRNNIRINSVV